ncbi:hypothetical protein NMG60_11030388 [Bertholletia excelsa]
MSAATVSLLLPSELKPSSLLPQQLTSFFISRRRSNPKKHKVLKQVARLFGPAIFEASKLKVHFLGVDDQKHPGDLPRTYTLTHSDVTSKLTLAISQTVNNAQIEGWYNRLQRDEVVAEWKKVKGKMSLHVHCHISGLRYFIFCKELPVVLKAFVHGDVNLLSNYPELQEALVWVYFHSSIPAFNRVECWGPLREAAWPSDAARSDGGQVPLPCQGGCTCCFLPMSLIPWSEAGPTRAGDGAHHHLTWQRSGGTLFLISLVHVLFGIQLLNL